MRNRRCQFWDRISRERRKQTSRRLDDRFFETFKSLISGLSGLSREHSSLCRRLENFRSLDTLPPTSGRHMMLARPKECCLKPRKSRPGQFVGAFGLHRARHRLSACRTPKSHRGWVTWSSCGNTVSRHVSQTSRPSSPRRDNTCAVCSSVRIAFADFPSLRELDDPRATDAEGRHTRCSPARTFEQTGALEPAKRYKD